ncbi:hypothetical protein SteCoe_2457 [Stentor coeruleus]|uniref:Prohibitin n=1 Tax=Stentor coeruleus TaxID=5963 RepID=A0A1R2CZH7_9CILI|nr:hypothetical protein SteCoe_2457 [Stentor coeruleus]
MADNQTILTCVGVIIVGVIILIVMSFSSLEYAEYGLEYDKMWKTVGTTVFTAGIHMIGPMSSFIKYPSNAKTIEFSTADDSSHGLMECRTSDGLKVELEVTFNYELQQDCLFDLYMNFGDNYEGFIVNAAIDETSKVATNYTAYNFFVNRSDIGEVMAEYVKLRMKKDMGILTKFFKLKNVDLPDDFEDALQQTQVKKQDIEKAEAEKSKAIIQMQTNVTKAVENTKIILNEAYGTSNATTSASKSEVKTYNYTERNTIEGFKNLKTSANLDNEGLLNYIKAQIIQNYEGDNMVISIS